MGEFPKQLNLFKVNIDISEIYEYENIPDEGDKSDFNKRGNFYYSLKKFPGAKVVDFDPYKVRKFIDYSFKLNLTDHNYKFQGKYVAYKETDGEDYDIFKMFKGFEYRFIPIENDLFLALDHRLVIKVESSIKELLEQNVSTKLLIGNTVEIRNSSMNYNKGKLINIEDNVCSINVYKGGIELIDSEEVYPLCRTEELRLITQEAGNRIDVVRLQRSKSLFNSRRRLVAIKEISKELSNIIFPFFIEDVKIDLMEILLPIEETGYSEDISYDDSYLEYYDGVTIKCNDQLDEPLLEFNGANFTKPYPTEYAPYKHVESISLTFYFPNKLSTQIDNISKGIKRYLENYFYVDNVKITLQSIDEDPLSENYLEEIKKSLKFSNDVDIGIVYVPESMKYRKNSPYYTIKAYFASLGIPTQMITEKSFSLSRGLNYTWLNMGTAIIAKCGGIPWVLKEKLEETDIVIGMSLSSSLSNIGEDVSENRFVGFANVFNKYGKWCYFCGTAQEYHKNAILEQITEILNDIKDYYSKNKYSSPKNIVIHNSKRTNNATKYKIYEIVKDIFGSDCRFAFITIDESHNYRCFDSNSRDGSLGRGYFVYLNNKEILLSTTGASNLGGSKMGTPRVLHIIAHQYPEKFLSLENVAKQVLALTKLNWASVTPVQREPVTINYANRMAKIAANIGVKNWENISLKLYNKPWFI